MKLNTFVWFFGSPVWEKLAQTTNFSRYSRHLRGLKEIMPPVDDDFPNEPTQGYLFPEAPAIVGAAVDGMQRKPDLFDQDYAEALHRTQGRAFAWRTIHSTLVVLADRAEYYYQQEQAVATRRTLELLRGIRQAARSPVAAAADIARYRALRIAEAYLERWQARMTGKGRKGRRKRRS